MERNYKLLTYQLLCVAIFSLSCWAIYKPIDLHNWVVVVTFAAAATLFDLKPIVLPSSDNLSLVTPLLFTAGLLYGVFNIFLICTLMVIILIVINHKKWVSHVFNGVQFSLSGYVGFVFYHLFNNTEITSYIVNLPAFIAFSISFYFTNVIFLTVYLSLRSQKPLVMFLKVFFDRKAVLIFFR